MNSAAKLLLVLLLVAGAAVGVYLTMSGSGAEPPPTIDQPQTTQPTDPTPEPQPQPQQVTVETRQPAEPAPVRTEVTRLAAANADAAQGVRGRVLLPSGQPAPDMPVYLLQSSTANALEMYLASRSGQTIKPVAQTATDKDGTFALGVQKAGDSGQSYDLRVVSDEYPELQHRSIKIRSDEWVETGDLKLELGIVVQGRVLDEAGGFPIASAQVFLNNPNQAYQMLATPGRERGVATQTDASGFFRFVNAPPNLPVTIGAEAPEYAYAELANLPIRNDAPNEFELKLARGLPIRGTVVDKNGKPVASAQIQAVALSAKTPQNATTRSAETGVFELPTLREGPYQLTATAPGYEEVVKKPVMTGETDVTIVLEQRGRVELKVLAANGTPIKVYRVSLKRWFPNNPMGIGKVPEFRDVSINPGDYQDDYAIVHNVPAGDYVFQIIEKNHAKTLSPPFTMTNDPTPPRVEVTLTMGASVTGVVVDERGAPVANADVVTDMNGGFAADSDFFNIFRSFLPDKHTVTQTKTDGQGRFKLAKLAFAEYMLRVSHPDFCEGSASDIKLESEGQQLDVGTIALTRGCIVQGVCTRGGNPAGQIRVTIGPPDNTKPELDAQGRPKMFFSATAITGNDGSYRFSKRIPPGTYKIFAALQAGGDNIFDVIMQQKQTERTLMIGIGQQESVQNFDVPAQ